MDNVSARFCKSIVGLDTSGLDVTYDFRIRCLIYSARNKLSKRAIEEKFDYLFFVDDDMTFPANTLKALIEDNKDVVTALCFMRGEPHRPAIYNKKCDYIEDVKESLFRIGYCGGACLLIKTSVLEDVYKRERTFFLPTKGLGEDLSFCKRVNGAGREIWCDPKIKCGHMTYYEVTDKDYNICSKKQDNKGGTQ